MHVGIGISVILVIFVVLGHVIWRLASLLETYVRPIDDPQQLPWILIAMVRRVRRDSDRMQLEAMRSVLRTALIDLDHIKEQRESEPQRRR
ncbi:hypothetical protein ABEG10_38100 (plasmid) [Burkholderia cenocepacia]|uniref:hypothetical protein n=1 Tax=Burkholderia cenocepacia TaxID=95486 RepID=UPI00209F094E|nr:hypothetical protein [Burkholderia cenocepacia]MCO8402799.1 hypothetical protein [Burkholderia cenocepacia]MCO8415038.1 hypothetical protein [Burkholderia cenocepacia]MCO8423066.1 hypothetical protein [Burkholderia cenocepacia]MCO8474785.1 hypothetical protein [Burkholderia cenocepacia]MCO8482035.1 hypothetical protein [Burkholderia cenocepacia]